MQGLSVQRRLMAIMAMDMVGYSRLMELDETGTLARLKTHRLELIDPAIAKSNGRIVKTTGDGLLVEFSSVVDAVSCGVEIQERMARRNADMSADRQVLFRMGINLGDVIVEEDDVFGDGVNIAARLQQLAPPGGIWVSRGVCDQLGGKIDFRFESLGSQKLKNIERPIEVFSLALTEHAAAPPPRPAAVAAPATGEQPTIAVLPFANMSGEAEQEFFADGLTEDVITDLCRFRDLFVISRNSTFVYKGRAVSIHAVAKELGVQFVVEGSVRKAGNRVRITVQLIDALTDTHIWAERYDREIEDIFAIQDEVTSAIVSVLPGRLEAVANERVTRKPTENMAAYELTLAAKVLHHRSLREENARAQDLITRAVALDPGYAHARAWRACILGQAWIYGWCPDRAVLEAAIVEELEAALALEDRDADVHRILAAVNITYGRHEQATYHQGRALSLNPNYDLVVVQQGELLTWLGRPDEGIPWILKAMRLNPYHPERYWSHLGRAYFVARRYREAVEAFSKIRRPDQYHLAFLAAAHAHSGDASAAAGCAARALDHDPAFRIGAYLETLHYAREEDLAHHREGLLKAGLPE
ncbi:MAG: adenylate/guanylate cyclase domain-containing protein [Parvibaculaceae bacterium]